MMDIGLAFSYVFKDREWFRKIAIPALCSLIPVIGPFILLGWSLKVTKNVIEGQQDYALPELNFGSDLVKGLMTGLIILIYSLPFIILAGLGGYMIFAGTEGNSVLLWLSGLCIVLVALLVLLFTCFLRTAALANYVAKGAFGAAFKFGEIFRLLKKSFGSWVMVVLGQMLTMLIIAPLGLVACGIGMFITSSYGAAFYTHLLGQAYNQSTTPGIIDLETL
jgi:hypothetical protein